ncbi:hypothetical protein NA57DRAFT_67043 [Rhizodiscina lignyota]|uniref:Impact N-terminal domain-containing protein n=1 Tax=Rhizodiscina lignyota TaxID=1504668 RepID=A0A9P4M7Q7_9PEZI|nr:hypothetical protein NA57DRAFT_67043 [Rhizodiscina lignyota]
MAAKIQALLRFLSQDAKVPLATAMAKVKELQKEELADVDALAKTNLEKMQTIFRDEKLAKQVLNAAKRVSKKRGSSDVNAASPPKKARKVAMDENDASSADIEASLTLPSSNLDEDALAKVVLFTNRAPLVLAFAVTLLNYTMPDQPLSSKLSLAQAVVSINSRSKAVSLGLESGRSAEEEGFGEGQPVVTVMGREIRVMKRWGYEWKKAKEDESPKYDNRAKEVEREDEPALWGLDLEALKKNSSSIATAHVHSNNGALPIYTAQSARAYIMKAFDTAPDPGNTNATPKKQSASARATDRENNLGHLLKSLDLLYKSWSAVLSPTDLDKRSWSWYMAVRPSVADGVAGWGGKSTLKLDDILDLRRKVT